MALEIRQMMSDLTQLWARRGHRLEFGAAVTLGYATLGQIGFAGRVDYAAVGPVADLAEQLSARATDGQLLITQPVYAAVEDQFEISELGQLSIPGFLRPVSVFNIDRPRSDGQDSVRDSAATRSNTLSVREREVARLIARGLTNRQIAEELVISERTADGHAEHIRDKLGVHNRAEIAAWVIHNGLAEEPQSRS
jgi:DNA-binding CsgD family transcriptional regulator